ncbi:MAG: 5'(3')-deoxyribonucleotidase [Flavobacteriaceae bacterium]|nr:5'(3')-deoxyribonucleotidase [Flavobacteriaceae bacterium]
MTIFIDMDEVIADTYGMHLELYNKEFNANLTLEECSGSEIYDMVPENCLPNVRKHVWTDGFFRGLKPLKDSQEVVKQLFDKHDVYIASAAMQFPNSLLEKSEWLDEHFPFITWERRILCGHKHVLKGDVLIDDRSFNLEPFEGRSIMFSSPHNHNVNKFERVNSWKEVADLLL